MIYKTYIELLWCEQENTLMLFWELHHIKGWDFNVALPSAKQESVSNLIYLHEHINKYNYAMHFTDNLIRMDSVDELDHLMTIYVYINCMPILYA